MTDNDTELAGEGRQPGLDSADDDVVPSVERNGKIKFPPSWVNRFENGHADPAYDALQSRPIVTRCARCGGSAPTSDFQEGREWHREHNCVDPEPILPGECFCGCHERPSSLGAKYMQGHNRRVKSKT